MAGIYDEQILGAKQQAETARKLREGIKSPEGQMVSGWYVPPSITQYMAEALKGYNSSKAEKTAQSKYETLTKQKADETARYLKEMQPRQDVSVTDAGMEQFTQPQDFSLHAAINNGSNPQPQPLTTQTTYTQPDEQTRMAALLGLSQVNPEAAAPAIGMEQWQMDRQDKQAAVIQAQQNKLELQHQAALDRAAMVQSGGNTKQYFQPIQTAEGVYAFNSRTGKMELTNPVKGATNDPALQRALAGAKAEGKVTGTAQGTAQTALDNTVFQGKTTLKQLDDLLAHPGFNTAVGFGNEITRFAPSGSEPRNFLTRLDQLKGGQFLQAYQALKGGGQITEIEGKKATEAIARMNPTSSEAEFKQAVKDFADVIRAGMSRAQNQAQGNFAPAGSPNIDALLQKYGH